MQHPKWLATDEVEPYITARGRLAHRRKMVLNPSWRSPSAEQATALVKAYARDEKTCQSCGRRVHWYVMPGHDMAPAMDDDGRLVHVGCLPLLDGHPRVV